MKILTSHTTMASWLTPLRPCCVNMQEDRLFPLLNILFGKDRNLFRDITWSEDVLLAFFWPHNPISRQDGETVSPLLLLLQALLLLAETQHPICSQLINVEYIRWKSCQVPSFFTLDLTWNWDSKYSQRSKQFWSPKILSQ